MQMTDDRTGWQPIATAPRDGTSVLLFLTKHGQVEGRFCPGEWSEDTHISPREYSGAVWSCADDAITIEVEDWCADAPLESQEYGDGEATHWRPLLEPPQTEEITYALTQRADTQTIIAALQPMATAPRNGDRITVRYESGDEEAGVYWSDERYCVLGAPQGSFGPGWLSTEAGDLPIDDDEMIGWSIPHDRCHMTDAHPIAINHPLVVDRTSGPTAKAVEDAAWAALINAARNWATLHMDQWEKIMIPTPTPLYLTLTYMVADPSQFDPALGPALEQAPHAK